MGVRGRDGAREGSTKEVRVCFFPSLLFSVHVVVRMGAAGENAVLLRCLRLVRGCAQREKEKRGTEQRWKKQRTKKSINKGTWVSPVCFSLQRQYKKVTAQCTGAAKVRVRQRRRERQSHSGRERERERESRGHTDCVSQWRLRLAEERRHAAGARLGGRSKARKGKR